MIGRCAGVNGIGEPLEWDALFVRLTHQIDQLFD